MTAISNWVKDVIEEDGAIGFDCGGGSDLVVSFEPAGDEGCVLSLVSKADPEVFSLAKLDRKAMRGLHMVLGLHLRGYLTKPIPEEGSET